MTIRYALLTVAALSTLAAGPCAAKPVTSFGVAAEVAADTIRITANACQSSAPTVACRVVVTGTVGGAPITFAAQPNLTLGQILSVSQSVACTNLAPVSVTVSSTAINSAGVAATATTAIGTATCPAGAPNPANPFTVTITVGP